MKGKRSHIIAVVLILGILFRFINLDGKLYWYDETLTSLRISGHTQTELVEQAFNGRVISVQELQEKYQYPNSEKGLNDAINAFAGNAEHSPLYYLMARFWVQTFGNSVVSIRSLSAFISWLAFPCIYWLSLELFASSLTGWVAVILIAVSPFHVLYAQQARQYSLWTVAILLSSAALLKASKAEPCNTRTQAEPGYESRDALHPVRWGKASKAAAEDTRTQAEPGYESRDALHPVHWVIYALTVAIGLYSHLFFGLVAIGHGIYIVAIEGFRFSKKAIAYLLASLTGLLIFSPWLLIIAANLSQIIQNTATTNSTVRNLPLRWLLNLSRLFFDLNHGLSFINPILYITAILSIWALYFVCRNTPKPTWLFIFTLIGVTGLALILPDLILGGRRSSVTRYAIPCFLGIQVAVAYLLTVKITKSQHVKRWSYVLVALIASGVISCVASSFFPIWWHNSHTNSKYNPQVARIVNQAEHPLLVTDEIPGRVLAFSHLLKPEVNLQLVVEGNIPKIPDKFGNAFLYRPSERLRQGIEQEQNFKIEPVYKDWLWKLRKKV
ncbi:hypothetical protein MiSe_78090 [Microseira wollei NIES-4236]|uniref:Glycosyltransferase RgtA/B/C/D-like domain-containing protein n=2 Tax=Microseira wollei TaxID=467598 RepID=A0AAV3XQE2_9CYAN|nr:hypothetical protein MiSe_78090 [Microseira wollei NIES-4236]